MKKSFIIKIASFIFAFAMFIGIGFAFTNFSKPILAFAENKNIPAEAKEYNGHYYYCYELSKSWTDAEAYCESLGGHLAVVTSAEENTWIINNFNVYSCWLGGYKENNIWEWVTGEEWNYTDWRSGEQPDNSKGIEDKLDYLDCYTQWNDASNTARGIRGFICEWETAEQDAKGSCGTSSEWNYTADTGVLSITGSGTISSLEQLGVLLKSHITKIIIPSTITTIGNYAFSGCSNVEEIVIEEGVTVIGEYAFYKCQKLDNVEIPGSVTTIGKCAFYNCEKLDNVEIPGSVTTIGDYAFDGCISLETINLPTTLTSIGKCTFYNCEKLDNVEIPGSVTTIGDYAFSGCTSFTEINVPKNVTTIGSYAFSDCTNVKKITLEEGITTIGEYAFANINKVTKLTIPTTVSFVGQNIFSGMSALEELTMPFVSSNFVLYFGTSSYSNSYQAYRDYTSGSSYNRAYSDCYYIPSGLKKVSITKASTIPEYAFEGCTSITEFELNEGITTIGDYAFDGCISLETINLPTTLTSIGRCAFYNCEKLDNVEIPGSVTTIGDYAFFKCKALTTNVGDGVTTIGSYAFYECSSLGNQTFPSATTSIGSYAFYGCSSFDEINVPKNVTSIGSYAFSDCTNVEKISLEEGITFIYEYAFANINKVTKLTIPTTVSFVGQNIFSGMSALEELTMPFVSSNFVLYFGTSSYSNSYQAYRYYTSGSSYNRAYSDWYYIPSGLKKVSITKASTIPEYAFEGCTSITEFELNEGIKNIGTYAFGSVNINYLNDTNYQYKYSALESINLPSTLTTIGTYAFYNCQLLDNVEIPGSVTTIGDYAFYKCKNANITVLKQSTNVTVYSNTFTNVPMVKYYDYFSYTNGNNTFYYNVIDSNAIITKTTTTNTDLTLPTTLGDYTVTKVDNMGVANCTTLTSVVIPANIIELGDYAFSGCTGLTIVTIPTTCLHVGNYAFNGCYNITTTTIAEGVKYVGDYAFFNCIKLQEIVVPDTCEYLGQGAFYNCSSMKTASIGITVPEINDYTFMNCSAMETIVVGLKVTAIGNYAFKNCSSITKITLRSGVLTVGDGAFMNCSGLTKATLAATITDIGSYAFYGCSSLTSVTIPKLVTVINESTFEGCSALVTASCNGFVTEIEDKAFYGTALTAFTFKEGLERLGSFAFAHANLITVNLPDSLTIIGQHVFDYCQLTTVSMPSCVKLDANCKKIFENNGSNMIVTIRYVADDTLDDYLMYMSNAKQVIIENGVAVIGDYTFAKNTFDSIELPTSITAIGNYAFYLCENLTTFTVPLNTLTIGTYAFWKVDNEVVHELLTLNVYYNKGTICDSLFAGQHMQYVIVGDSVETIGDYVFSSCPNLRTVIVGDSVETIGDKNFANCGKLEWVSVPDVVHSFGNNNFLNDNSVTLKIRKVDTIIDDNIYYDNLLFVTTVTIEDGIKTIGQYAFYNDTSLLVVTVPNSVDYIGQYAFYNCNSISEINIPSGVEAIYSHTFFGCASLESITTPNTVKFIEDYAFYGCVEATSLIISNTCTKIDSNAFYNCKSLTALIIPDSVQYIGTYAFRSCIKITELRFSDNVEEIGACAFYDCNLLEKVYLGKRIIELDDRLFYGCVNLTDLYVYAHLSYVDELAFYGAEECVIHMGYDTYMSNMFDELGMTYEIDPTIVCEYKVAFVNYDDSIISSLTYHSGDTVAVPANPTKSADETYTYAFAGWDKTVTVCSGNKTYKATYTPVYIEYTVKFVDYDDSVISNKNYHYGDVVTAPANPTRSDDMICTFEFDSWDSTVSNCSGDKTYKATYNISYIDYKIVFKNYDGSQLSSKTYHYNDAIVKPSTPTKSADNTYTYVFASWGNNYSSICKGNATYIATYTPTYIDYTVKFLDYDSSEISSNTYHYGDAVTAPTNPTRATNNIYTYSFKNWDKAVTKCSGNATYTAVYNETYIEYMITFKNYDDSVISSKNYHYGEIVIEPATPTKASDNTYIYSFANWDKVVSSVTCSETYKATYTPTYIEYIVKFVDYDDSVISNKNYHYGDVVTAPANPTRSDDMICTFEFDSWDSTVSNCSGDKTYKATYNISYIDYKIVFKNYDGSQLSSKTYHYNDAIVKPSTPTKSADNTYTYVFASWGNNYSSICKGNATYIAEFTPTYIDYTIKFMNYDDSEISSKTYHYGDTVIEPTTPTKPSDEAYTYTFKSWDREVVNCVGNATYKATYNSSYIDYTVVFKDYDGTIISSNTYHYGDTIVVPTNPSRASDGVYDYTFIGWDKQVNATCDGDAEYKATYSQSTIPVTPSGVSGCSGTVGSADATGNMMKTIGTMFICFMILIIKKKRKIQH